MHINQLYDKGKVKAFNCDQKEKLGSRPKDNFLALNFIFS